MKKRGARSAGRAESRPRPARRSWAARFVFGLILWLPVSAFAWAGLTPFYNLFLVRAGERLSRLSERPAVTRIALDRGEQAVISRDDTRAGGRLPYPLRATDLHFPLLLLGGMFLAVPDVPWRQRLENLGLALLVAICSHVLDLFFWVKFVYATQLGEWSLARYSPFERNFWGLGKHVLDLPVKLALPLVLWCLFYLRQLLSFPDASAAISARRDR
jgi:hypothetical protein